MHIVVSGDPQAALRSAHDLLVAKGYRITPTDTWSGTAELGSKTKGALLGAMSLYINVRYQVTAGQEPGTHVVNILQGSTGWMGGAVGASRTNKAIEQLRADLEQAFSTSGNLVRFDVT